MGPKTLLITKCLSLSISMGFHMIMFCPAFDSRCVGVRVNFLTKPQFYTDLVL